MENSELQEEKIIKLGKLFVKELNLEPGVDTLSRWMAHYLAEKMTEVEILPIGNKRDQAQKECFEVILKLWERRWTLLNGKRPFENFEPILRLLEKINPENDHDYYTRVILNRQYPELEKTNLLNKDATDWIKVVNEIDRVSRIWIDFCLKEAVKSLTTEKTEEWIKEAENIPNNEDVQVIKILFNTDSKTVATSEELSAYRKKQLEKRIDELNNFIKLNALILKSYQNELEKL
jgi:hypothetical protein